MTLPQNVKDADEEMVAAGGEIIWRHYPAIRAHLMSQDAEIELLRVGCEQNLLHAQMAESRLAAANALLRFVRTRFDAYMDDSDRASIEAYLSENADVQP